MESPTDDLKTILGPNEQVELLIRKKIYRPKFIIDSVAITNERIILRYARTPELKKDYGDYNYRDVEDVVLRGVLRSSLRVTLKSGGESLLLDDLPNSDAQKAYGIIRENLVRYQPPVTAATLGVPPVSQVAPPPSFSAASCSKCGSPLVAGQKLCGNCGQSV